MPAIAGEENGGFSGRRKEPAEEEYECFAEADSGLRANLCLRARGAELEQVQSLGKAAAFRSDLL